MAVEKLEKSLLKKQKNIKILVQVTEWLALIARIALWLNYTEAHVC